MTDSWAAVRHRACSVQRDPTKLQAYAVSDYTAESSWKLQVGRRLWSGLDIRSCTGWLAGWLPYPVFAHL